MAKAVLVDVLTELYLRNCHYVIWNLLDNLGLVELVPAMQVSRGWQEICRQYMEARLTSTSRRCFDLFLSAVNSIEEDGNQKSGRSLREVETLCWLAIDEGHLDVLKHVHENWNDLFQKIFLPGSGCGYRRRRRRFAAPALRAARYGRLEVLTWLLDFKTHDSKGRVRDYIPHDKRGMLVGATEGGHLNVLKNLVDKYKIDLSEHKDTLLTAASKSGQVSMLDNLTQTFKFEVSRDCVIRLGLIGHAARMSHVNVLEWIVEKFPDIMVTKIAINEATECFELYHREFRTSKCKGTLIHVAAKAGALEVLQFFHKQAQGPRMTRLNIDWFQRESRTGMTIVHFAINSGHLNTLQWIRDTFPEEFGRELGKKTNFGQNVFHFAAESRKSMEVLQMLHSSNLDSESMLAPDFDGNTLMNYAIKKNDKKTFKWLLKTFPGRWSFLGSGTQNALEQIHTFNQLDHLILILEHHFDTTDIGRASTDQVSQLLLSAVKRCNAKAIHWILSRYPEKIQDCINKTDSDGNNVLHLAAQTNKLDIVKVFYRHCPDTMHNLNLLHQSLSLQDLTMLEWLLTTFQGLWDLGRQRSSGKNAYHKAAMHSQLKALQLLHDNCCGNVNGLFDPDTSGATVLHTSVLQGDPRKVQWLLETFPGAWSNVGTDTTLFQHIMGRNDGNDIGLLELIHNNYQDLPTVTFEEGSLVHFAVVNNTRLPVIAWLLERFPSKWNLTDPAKPNNFVWLAIEHNRLDVLMLVYEKFPNQAEFKLYDVSASPGWSAFHIAAKLGHDKILKWLLDNFLFEWETMLMFDSSPSILHVAVENKKLCILEMFWQSHSDKVDFFATDHQGLTLMQKAVGSGQMNVQQWLTETFRGQWDLRSIQPVGFNSYGCICESCNILKELVQKRVHAEKEQSGHKRKYPFEN